MTYESTRDLRIGDAVYVRRADDESEHWRGAARFLAACASYEGFDEDVQMSEALCVVKALNEEYAHVQLLHAVLGNEHSRPNGWVHPETITPVRDEQVHEQVDGGDSVVLGGTLRMQYDPSQVTVRTTVADEATPHFAQAAQSAARVLRERGEKYDNDGLATLRSVAVLWSEWLQVRFPEVLGGFMVADVCELMTLHKQARLMHDPLDEDHSVDMIGYASLARFAREVGQ